MEPSAMQPSGGFRFTSKLERRIVRRAGAAVGDFGLIDEGDHILVAVSGGKDSLSMLRILQLLLRRSPVAFHLTAVTIHQGYASFSTERLEEHYRRSGVTYRVEQVPIDQILAEKLAPGVTPCSLCSRIRRGALYTLARDLGFSKVALGHHLDDLLETLLMNLFFGGRLRSMAPFLRSDDGRNTVIRPLCYVPEAWLAEYARQMGFPVTTCATEGCGDRDGARQRMKRLIADLDRESPGVRWHMLRALRNVRSEHLLDRTLLSALGPPQYRPVF
jgi:tRNA 2-thiocytidine biosynthesis protein TtcA